MAGVTPARHACTDRPPAPRQEADLHAEYVDRRTRELLARAFAGVPSSSVDDATLERSRALSRESAEHEWVALQAMSAILEQLVREQPERTKALRAGAERLWARLRDAATYGETVPEQSVREGIIYQADQVELELRIGR